MLRTSRSAIAKRLAKPLHTSVRTVLRQAWELDDAEKAEKLIRNQTWSGWQRRGKLRKIDKRVAAEEI